MTTDLPFPRVSLVSCLCFSLPHVAVCESAAAAAARVRVPLFAVYLFSAADVQSQADARAELSSLYCFPFDLSHLSIGH